jgi:hypothetical protein
MFHGEQWGSYVGVSLRSVSSEWQLSAPLAICSQIQVVSSVLHHGVVYF